MANTKEKIEKDGKTFHALVQHGHDPKYPWYKLGDRVLDVSTMICTDMYDRKENKIFANCLLHIVATANIVQANECEFADINLADEDAKMPDGTARYLFTNTNRD